MSRKDSKPAAPFDDDVAALFAQLGVGSQGAGYRDFSAARLQEPPAPVAPPAAAVQPLDEPAPAAPQPPAPAPAPAPKLSVVPMEPVRAPAQTSLERLFQRLAEGGGEGLTDSPLRRLRSR